MSKKKRKHTNQVYQIPSNAELDKIKENPLLSDIVKTDIVTLHKINKGLKSMVMDVINLCQKEISIENVQVSRIDVFIPHVVQPQDTEYITSEIQIMVHEWFKDTSMFDETKVFSQAFIICMVINKKDTGELYGNFIYIHALPEDLSDSFTASTLAIAED